MNKLTVIDEDIALWNKSSKKKEVPPGGCLLRFRETLTDSYPVWSPRQARGQARAAGHPPIVWRIVRTTFVGMYCDVVWGLTIKLLRLPG